METAHPGTGRALTQTEIIDCVQDAFLAGSASKIDLINAALRCDARPAVFAAINKLPERRFTSVLDMLSCMTEVTFQAAR
ncbi:DUF2795 domain-containing protein [Saccharothrix sp. S26]|uniref:DUF2795 domain-containing protein n=1 Tax=Saccharothrix sp. S26 TaxID=2907215 RepID=UPI001F26DE45|nr:DUF2795 domain-containing protein [Saccharothrix sp. S26]MCE6995498.1 DUF2795 domain-containing protein [Saccharothrix sp. S26]